MQIQLRIGRGVGWDGRERALRDRIYSVVGIGASAFLSSPPLPSSLHKPPSSPFSEARSRLSSRVGSGTEMILNFTSGSDLPCQPICPAHGTAPLDQLFLHLSCVSWARPAPARVLRSPSPSPYMPRCRISRTLLNISS